MEPDLYFIAQFVPKPFDRKKPRIGRAFSNLTAYFTKSEYCHTGVIESLDINDFGQSDMIDAWWVVDRVKLQHRVDTGDFKRADIWAIRMPDINREEGLDFVRKQIGKPYDPLGLGQQIIIIVKSWAGQEPVYDNNSLVWAWYCSELADGGLAHSRGMNYAKAISPGGIHRVYGKYMCWLCSVYPTGEGRQHRKSSGFSLNANRLYRELVKQNSIDGKSFRKPECNRA